MMAFRAAADSVLLSYLFSLELEYVSDNYARNMPATYEFTALSERRSCTTTQQLRAQDARDL